MPEQNESRERVLRENDRILALHREWLRTYRDGAYEDGAVSHRLFLECDLDVTIVEPALGGDYAVVQTCIMEGVTPYGLQEYTVRFAVMEAYGQGEVFAYTRTVEVPCGEAPENIIELALATLHENQDREG